MTGRDGGSPADTWPPVVVCGQCAGLVRVLDLCRCVHWGDRFLIDETAEIQPGTRPYQACELCHGTGYVSRSCSSCGQTGRQRAQLVLTMANLDTGAVASANVVPGGVEPRRGAAGRWELVLSPLLAELATTVRVASWWDMRHPDQRAPEFTIPLPRNWTPELPAAERRRLEAEALARYCWLPWRVWLGSMTRPPARDLGQELGWLCHLADLLCLDLVVEARQRDHGSLVWDIRYDLPGGEVPLLPGVNGEDLPSAVAAATVARVMSGLSERSRSAPAHYLRPNRTNQGGRTDQLSRSEPQSVDLDQLARRVQADLNGLDDVPGAQGIWRDGRWWHTRLEVGDTVETLTEQPTGQVVRRQVTRLRRSWEPPAPGWRGEPIPERPCPNCHPEHRIRPCLCTLGNRPAEPGCPACGGAGLAVDQGTCYTCRGSGRIQHGAVVTLTDLRDLVVHLNWPATEAPVQAPQVGNQPGGHPIHQLPPSYRLRHWAGLFRWRPGDLVELDGHLPVGQDLLEGVVAVDQADVDPLRQYLVDVSGGRPGARLVIGAVPPRAPRVTELIRLVHGLHQTITITMQDHHLNESDPSQVHGERWQIEMTSPSTPIDPGAFPYHLTPEAAAAHLMAFLENAVTAAVPTDLGQAIPVPQTPHSGPLVEDPLPLIRRLARYHAGQPVSVRYERGGCHLYVHEKDRTLRHLATAPTLASAVTALGLDRQ